MPRLNLYEQQTSMGQVRASAADTGAQVGEAVNQAGNVLMDIGTQIKTREDVLDRVRLLNDFDTNAVTQLEALQAGEDIASKATVDKYNQGLRESVNKAVAQHSGTSASRAALQAQLENQAGQYAKSAMGAQIKAQHNLIAQRVDQVSNELGIKAGFAPDQFTTAFAMLDSELDKLGPAISPAQQQEYRRTGRAKIATNAISGFMQRGDFTSARAMMKDPNIGPNLSPDTARSFTMDITVDERKAEIENKRQDQNVARFAQRLGRDMTPEEVLKARSLPDKKNMTIADEITEYELVTGKPASQDVVDRMYKVASEGGSATSKQFGNSLQGIAIAYVTENAVAYANGMLDPAQARTFQSAYAEAYKPIERQDPDTKLWTKIAPTVPGFARDAMERGSGRYGGMAPVPAPGAQRPGSPEYEYAKGLLRQSGGTTAQIPADSQYFNPDAAANPPASVATGGRLWNVADQVAGPVAGVKRAIGGGPVSMGIGGAEVSAAQEVEMLQKNLVNTLRKNPRYSEGERQSIAEDIKITPEMLSNPTAYRLRLVEIGRYIQDELKANSNIQANPEKATAEQRQMAIESNRTLSDFYVKLGLPQRVKSVEEAKKLAPGTQFLDENWILRQTPNRK